MGRWQRPKAADGGVPPHRQRLAPPYPSTMLRMVPLPICRFAENREDQEVTFAGKPNRATKRSASAASPVSLTPALTASASGCLP